MGRWVLRVNLNFGNYLFLLEDPLYVTSLSGIGQDCRRRDNYRPVDRVSDGLPDCALGTGSTQSAADAGCAALLDVVLAACLCVDRVSQGNGVINNLLLSVGIIDEPLVMLQTDFAVYVGIVYTYLPFMILPLYANLVKLDEAYLEASSDLGARPVTTFLTVTVPLSLSGIIAGCMLVFIPAVGEFVIPALLGGPDTLMIGQVLWNEFFSNRDWPVASSVAIVMLFVLVIPIMLLRWAQSAGEGEAR